MTTPQIDPYVHRCNGPRWVEEPVIISVDAWDYEYGRKCDICGEPLVTTEQLITHIYKELTP